MSYIYLQRSTSGQATLLAKRAFERYAKSHGVTIKHYHANNGRFIEQPFKDHCKQNNQSLSHLAVNRHFQNAVAEKRIRDLQDAARTMLVHAKHHWPKAVNAHLWPYALCFANEIHVNTPCNGKKAPIELFSQTSTATSPRHFHPFACPVYVLNDCMQAGSKGPKWEERTRLGIYLGNSPVHTCLVALVLNTETGLVSLQFHVEFDDLFETVNKAQVKIHWHKATGFATNGTDQVEQEPPMPNAYFLPQSHQEQQAEEPEHEESRDLESCHSPQGETGSTTDTQKHTEPNMQGVGSEEALEMRGTTGASQGRTKANTNKSTTSQNKVPTIDSAQPSDHRNALPTVEPSTEPNIM